MSVKSPDVWEANLERTKKTMEIFREEAQLCSLILNSMWQMKDKLMNTIVTKWGRKELPPHQQFVAIYFVRNIMYLRGAYLLACGSLCEPSRDLLRTVMESLMRGYLFVVNRKEASLMYARVEGTITPEDRDFLQKRRFWPFKFLLGELYTKETRKSLKKVIERLSRSSHPSIMSAFVDLDYSEEGVKDCLNFILAFSYHNIHMMAEGFLSFLDEDFKITIRDSLKKIADFQEVIMILEPDKKEYSKKVKLSKGNFLEVLK